ncbi:MAG: phenylalanine--tRNA ligase subunit beta [Kiritimatiellae bacterium]|nr:phenylalanine--tRNA ligase subunit beta [Kiritimatiellia bacterium]
MKVPLSWLREYVDFDLPAAELADRLSLSGTEVEGFATVGGEYDRVVAAEILSVAPHPNANTLFICRVDDGQSQRQVVCGAPNTARGLKVPLAQPGAKLPNGMTVESARIRGQASEGMLCAEDELGLSDNHAGLMVLGAQVKPGTPFAEIAGPPETILDLEITPNRPDCLSIIGIAREVAALLGAAVRLPGAELPEHGPPVAEATRVDIQDPERCPRYTARVLADIRIGASPQWMQRRLTHCGLRPINNIVDITNYVLLECGHPLHAFDRDLLAEGRIVVRRAAPGEQMATLDGISRAISPEMLVIADAARPVALAGIMGGAGSEIRPETHTVLLESAYFAPVPIRKTSKQLGLATEASYRFERGTDIGQVEWASRRAAALMVAHAGAVACAGVVDVFPGGRPARRVGCRHARARALLGLEISDSDIGDIFRRLGCAVVETTASRTTVEIPTFRVDLEREADLIEEVARIHGLDRIPVHPPHGRLVPNATDAPVRAAFAARNVLVGLGLAECMNYSFVSERLLDLFDRTAQAARIALPNPISADHSLLRNSLIPQVVETLGRNRARQAQEAAVFEMGRVFFKDASGKLGEEERVAAGLMGPVGRLPLEKKRPVTDEEIFAWARGILEHLCTASQRRDVALRQTSTPWCEPGCAAAVMIDGADRGVIGLVSKPIRDEWRLLGPVAVFEIRTTPLLEHAFDACRLTPVAAYPAVTRDMALIVDIGVRHEQIRQIIAENAPPELETVELFDIFAGKSTAPGRKSLAYSCRYRSQDRTLTDEEVNCYHMAVKKAIKDRLDVDIREGL